MERWSGYTPLTPVTLWRHGRSSSPWRKPWQLRRRDPRRSMDSALSGAALRTKVFPVALNWLGVGIGIAGILSMVPALNGLAVMFGLLQIVWFAWLGMVMLRTRPDAAA